MCRLFLIPTVSDIFNFFTLFEIEVSKIAGIYPSSKYVLVFFIEGYMVAKMNKYLIGKP